MRLEKIAALSPRISPHASRAHWHAWAFLLFATAAFALLSFLHQKDLFDNLYTGARDLTFFTQSLWNASHGDGLRTTIGSRGTHLFSEHLYLSHWLLVPLYRFWPHPHALLLAQAIALSLIIPATYTLSRRIGVSAPCALALAWLAALHPSAHGTASGINLYGYHPDAWFPVLFLLAFQARVMQSQKRFWFLVLLSLASLEHYAIVWASVALYWFIAREDRNGAVRLGLLALCWYVAAVLLVPTLTHNSGPWYLSALKVFAIDRYTAALWSGLLYFGKHLLVIGGLAILSPLSLATLPMILLYVQGHATGYTVPMGVLSWHAAAVFPIMLVATAYALRRLERSIPSRFLVAGILIASLFPAWFVYRYVYDADVPALSTERRTALTRLYALVPADAPLAATFFLATHFSHRRDLLPVGRLEHANYVLIDLQPRFQYGEDKLSEEKREYLTGFFDCAYSSDTFQLYRRRGPSPNDGAREAGQPRCHIPGN